MRNWILILIVGAATALSQGCGDDDGSTDPDSGTNVDSGTDVDGSTTGATDFTVTVENIGTGFAYPASGVFNTPVGAATPGPILPTGAYSWTFSAARMYPGQMNTTRLSFATMLVASNDLFIAPAPAGLPLFDTNGDPITGNRTTDVMVWDAGTEDDEVLGGDGIISPNQKPNQAPTDVNVGPADPVNTVRLGSVTYPASLSGIEQFVELDVQAVETDREWVFTVTLTNVSTGSLPPGGPTSGATPLSPGVWVVHNQADTDPGPLFTSGETDRGEGLEALAEDGVTADLTAVLEAATGLTVVSSPGVWAVHEDPGPFFTGGEADRGAGLEAIAEDGDNTALAAALQTQTGIKSSGTVGTMPIGPGGSFTINLSAEPGDRLSFATMVVPSNDYLFTFDGMGVELFSTDGTPVSGSISASLEIWDAGTEIDQTPGVGLDQVHLQDAPNTGAVDPDTTVREVTGSAFPDAPSVLQVTVTPG